ncbi:MAG TPA: hypothetical protein PKY30_04815 [Myxococcota bacterium]|nr:hypothetical protein [Myxococcota bacterium]
MWLLLLFLTACPKGPAPTTASGPSTTDLWRIPLPGLVDVACDEGRCMALRGTELVRLPSLEAVPLPTTAALDRLRHDAQGWRVAGACADGAPGRCSYALSLEPLALGAAEPEPPVPVHAAGTVEEAESRNRWTSAWNHAIAEGWRSGFDRRVVLPGAAELQLLPGLDGTAQLRRTGENPAFIKLMLGATGKVFPGNLALHPTGVEVYLAAWPSPLLIALDPVSLDRRWVLPLDGGVQGLFIEPGGRFLLVASGDASARAPESWAWPEPDPAAATDPAGDEALRDQQRPAMSRIYAVDLQDHSVAVELPGQWRRWIPLPDGRVLVASSQQIVFFKP